MKKFSYVVSNEKGVRQKGTLSASSEDAATRNLRKEYDIIISITEKKRKPLTIFGAPSLSFEEKMMFTKHMSTMIKVGITITEALEIMLSQTARKNNRKMYEALIEMVKSGQSLAKSLQKYPKIFPEIFVNMIATGEEAGNLEQVLEYLDVQLEKEYELRRKVISAFIYPGVIISVTLILTLGIVIFVMPKITKIFTSFDVVLPLPTRMLMGFSAFITQKPLIAVGLTIGMIAFIITLFKLKALKPVWHTVFLRIPVFGKILIYSNLARFSRTINSLLQSGVPVTKALDITGNMLGNHIYKKAIKSARDKVDQGGKMSEALEGNGKLFPPLATHMLYIGESTGNMETTTDHLAQLYERNVDSITKNLSVLLEPMLLVFMGVLIGGIAVSIILPIYQLPNLIGQ